MADKLNADQQEKLSKIMAVPTKTAGQPAPAVGPVPITPPVGTATAVLPSYQVADLPNTGPGTAQSTTTVSPATTVVGSSIPSQKKSNSSMGILLLIGGVVLLGGYAYFWLIFFKII